MRAWRFLSTPYEAETISSAHYGNSLQLEEFFWFGPSDFLRIAKKIVCGFFMWFVGGWVGGFFFLGDKCSVLATRSKAL